MTKPRAASKAKTGAIRVGIGGWSFEPWRGVFYPKGLRQAVELAYAGAKLTSIEINATFYRLQSPASFRKWAGSVPGDFIFSVKGPRLVTNRRVLAEAGDFLKRFLDSGVSELGPRLGPLLWQFAPTKSFEELDFGKFLELLPPELDGRKLNHVVEVRHASFATASFVQLLREFGVSVAFTDAAEWPNIADAAGDIVYARLQRGNDALTTAYPGPELDAWAERAKSWAKGRNPDDLQLLTGQLKPKPRDVFVYFIHEGKLRAPAAAMALIGKLG